MEPGSAFVWDTGVLVSTVVDIVENRGIKTAILDVSFACHMPDCLEMPYKPAIRGAYHEPVDGLPTYRMGGNSCLSGDFVGDWSFDEPLAIGDKIVFEDMIHYTIVKTTMFNGISHPSLALWTKEQKLEIYREFDYNDYKSRMS
jgi:carboxynorspermidine decarboxylase